MNNYRTLTTQDILSPCVVNVYLLMHICLHLVRRSALLQLILLPDMEPQYSLRPHILQVNLFPGYG